jgi:glucan phosphoethanolaminetransferase (alkaline phosphatase superfamily)
LPSGWWPARSARRGGRARGTQLTLLLGAVTSLVASLLTTNNFGGLAVGFRHAAYLAPASFVLLAPVFAGRKRWTRVVSVLLLLIAAIAGVVMWWYAVRQPWADLRLPLTLP